MIIIILVILLKILINEVNDPNVDPLEIVNEIYNGIDYTN